MAKAKTDVAIPEEKDIALTEEEQFLALGKDVFILGDLMDGVEIHLPKIEIIHQGGLFEMPDGEMVKSFHGTILDMHKANAYWSMSLDDTGGGVFPDCHSLNGITPEQDCNDVQSKTCRECPKAYNNAEKEEGKPVGRICKNMKRVHILVEGSDLPFRLIASIKNIPPIDIYVSLLAGLAAPYPMINTEFSLKKVTNKAGIEYSELVLKRIGISHLIKRKEDVQMVKDMIVKWRGVMRDQVDFDVE